MHQRVRAWRKSSPRTARTWSPEPRAARTWGRTDAKVAFVRRRTRRQILCRDVDVSVAQMPLSYEISCPEVLTQLIRQCSMRHMSDTVLVRGVDERADQGPRPLTRSIGVLGGALGTGTAMTIAIAGLLCIGVAFCYSELGTLVPSAGGEYAMLGTLTGRFA